MGDWVSLTCRDIHVQSVPRRRCCPINTVMPALGLLAWDSIGKQVYGGLLLAITSYAAVARDCVALEVAPRLRLES